VLAPCLQLEGGVKSSGKTTLQCLRSGDCLRERWLQQQQQDHTRFLPRGVRSPETRQASSQPRHAAKAPHGNAAAREQQRAEQLPSTSLTGRRPHNSHPPLGQGVPTPSPTPGLQLVAASERKRRKARSSSLRSCIGELAAVMKPQDGGN